MNVICIVQEKSELKSFNTAKGEAQVVDVTLKSGGDVIQAAAFDELAKKIAGGELHADALYMATLVFSIRAGEKGKFQSCRIASLELFYEYNPTF